jgi:virginiamycin B lyase
LEPLSHWRSPDAPKPARRSPALRRRADGNIRFTAPGQEKIGRMTPQGSVTTFDIPATQPDPRGIPRGPDGNVWYVEFDDGYIGRVTPDGTITRFALPEGSSSSP